MKYKRILFEHAGTPEDRWPEELRLLAAKDPELARQLRAQADIACLLQVKRLETPDPAVGDRLRHRLEIRLLNLRKLRPADRLDALPDWVRMLTVVAVMFGLSIWTHREMLRQNDEEPAVALDATPIPALATAPQTDPMFFRDSFSPLLVHSGELNLLTPARSLELESSLLELGFPPTNRLEHSVLLPVWAPVQP